MHCGQNVSLHLLEIIAADLLDNLQRQAGRQIPHLQ